MAADPAALTAPALNTQAEAAEVVSMVLRMTTAAEALPRAAASTVVAVAEGELEYTPEQ